MRTTNLTMICIFVVGAAWADRSEAARTPTRQQITNSIKTIYRNALKITAPKWVANHFSRKVIARQLGVQGEKVSAKDVEIIKVTPTDKSSTLNNSKIIKYYSGPASGFHGTVGGHKMVSRLSMYERIEWQATTASGKKKTGTIQRLRHPAAYPTPFPHTWTIGETLQLKP